MRVGRGLATGMMWVLLAFAWALAAGPARAETPATLRGVALVIGNGDYEHLPKLANPPDDARAVEDLLSKLGFDTNLSSDRNAKRLSRDLEDFVEDAEGADVAILYYAGHGIEAGGENYLVPVDADVSSLAAAGERLVPITDIVARLRKSAAVVIVLLDACRDSPFPADAVLRPSPQAEPVPVAAGGLAVAATRGATALSARAAPTTDDGLGAVIGFAAEPGKVALDGKADGHSPYAAAILKHLGALDGAEFGMVMRMVAEEVYLDTGGRQHPWVNENLRRLLYFGQSAPETDVDQAGILGERRQLLVRISTLPDAQRVQAESLARTGNVPMSVVFAMMRALDVDPGDDPTKVEARLRAEIEQFAASRKAQQGLANPDPEIQRLTRLADDAELQGALNAADGFRDQAKTRVAALRVNRRQQAEQLRERLREDAEVYARSAETKKLLFHHVEAAGDYGEAHDILADWDGDRAADYRARQIDALLIDAELRGTEASLASAERLTRDALASGRGSALHIASLHHDLGMALMMRGTRLVDVETLRAARAELDQAVAGAAAMPDAQRARLYIDAGRAIGQFALTTGDAASIEPAETLFRDAASLAEKAADRASQSEAMFRVLQAQYVRWAAAPNQPLFDEMNAQTHKLMALFEDGEPNDFGGRYIVKSANIALDLARRQNTPEALTTVGEMTVVMEQTFDRERYPVIYAEIKDVQGSVALEWAERFGNLTHLNFALAALQEAIDAYTQAGYPGPAADSRFQKAVTLARMGSYEPGTERLEEALALLAEAERTTPHELGEPQRRALRYQRARISAAIASRTGDHEALGAAVTELKSVLDQVPAASDPQFHFQVAAEYGKADYWLAGLSGDVGRLREAVSTLDAVVAQYRQWGAPQYNAAPYAELLQQLMSASASIAYTTLAPDDIAGAIAVQTEFHDIAARLGNTQAAALAANDAAFLMTQQLREDFDEDTYARAAALVAETGNAAASLPAYAGYFANTACVLKTEKARHEGDLALARAALQECRAGLDLMDKAAQPQPQDAAKAAIAIAEALVGELEAR